MVDVFDLTGNKTREVNLPKVFSHEYRPDLIKKAVLAIQNNKRQAYGVNRLAGKRTSAHFIGRRHKHNSMANRELARLPRVVNSSPAQQLRARFVPQAKGGREAHPPKPEKIWSKKINKKEKTAAIKSAIAATTSFELVSKKHKIEKTDLPLIVVDDLQSIKKTKELERTFESMKLSEELGRAKQRKVRPGKGKMRGRKYKKRKSLLLVITKDEGVVRSAGNIPGVDICDVNNLNTELLAPGTHAGRLTIWTESSIKKIGEMYG